MKNEKEYSIEWGGRALTIGVELLAQQAGGSCTVRYGDTVVLCTATMGGIRDGLDFFPLQVDFEEKFYAAGKIKGSRYIKREGRPTDEAVLSGRMIDRALRPLFDDRMRNEVAVVTTVLSHDGENDADVIGLIGSSCALMLSEIPWNGPIAAARIGKTNGEYILNATYEQIAEGEMEVTVAGANGKTVMLEAGANIVSEEHAYGAIAFAQDNFAPVIELINTVAQAHGKEKVDPFTPKTEEEIASAKEADELHQIAKAYLTEHKEELFAEPLKTKKDRKSAVNKMKEGLEASLIAQEIGKDRRKVAMEIIEEFVDDAVTSLILDQSKRADGRAIDEIRALYADTGLLPRTHGSGLFMRGQTQVLSLVTLGGPGMEQHIDTMEFKTTRRFFHHYNFPSFAVSETKGNRGPGRREIGHGSLAEKAIIPVLPSKDDFPYTIRVVSEVLGSNGSSSMGSATASSLALMDAGVPIKAPVAGIAIGVASREKENKWKVITDIQDLEDGDGGMDFKVAGTREGITAIQMDTKTQGLPLEVVKEAFEKARIARMQILDVVQANLAEPRAELSQYAPRIDTMHINPEQIREVIGPGGKMINEIIAQTGVEIDIEDDGSVYITSVSAEGMEKAKKMILDLTREVEVGEIFDGKVTRIMDFGAFVEILPGKEGMVHVSELAPFRVGKVTDVVNVGDEVKVKVYEIDAMGRLNLSVKRANPDYKPESGNGGGRPNDRGPRPPRPGNGGPSFGGRPHGNDRPHDRGPRPSFDKGPMKPKPVSDDPFAINL
ncbi:MAG: polyribonucleotide nucleotidyltransferase [Patescibacteria group bacterium]|nr:polyribonucleotide nucleotidyltransferase [Patescibacteria group bacterium]